MGERNFREMLEAQWTKGNFVCVGLDSEILKVPACLCYDRGREGAIVAFNRAIVEATRDLVCAFKPNFAFYLELGEEGLRVLCQTVAHIHEVAPDVPVILDAKFGDIGNTNKGYAAFAFDVLGADAVTVHPYLGGEALAPFLERKDKGVIVLCRTSNQGAGEFQNGEVRISTEGTFRESFGEAKLSNFSVNQPSSGLTTYVYGSVYRYVALRVANEWNKNENCAVVVGATYPEELGKVREIVGDLPILIPGIGAQGGDVEKTVKAGRDSRGKGMIVNSSRGIIFASPGPDFAEAARREAEKLHDAINQYR